MTFLTNADLYHLRFPEDQRVTPLLDRLIPQIFGCVEGGAYYNEREDRQIRQLLADAMKDGLCRELALYLDQGKGDDPHLPGHSTG